MTATSTEPVTSTDVIRQALAARYKKINISGIARDVGVSVSSWKPSSTAS